MLQQKTIIGTDHKAGYSDHDTTVNATVKQLQQAGNTILQLIPREDMDYGSTVIIYQSPLSPVEPKENFLNDYNFINQMASFNDGGNMNGKHDLIECYDGEYQITIAEECICVYDRAGAMCQTILLHKPIPFTHTVIEFPSFIARSDWKQQEAINYATSIGLKHAFNDAGELVIELRYNKGICRIEDGKLYPCLYRDMNEWNGWLQPFLNQEQAEEFTDTCGNNESDIPVYKWEGDKLLALSDYGMTADDSEYDEIEIYAIDGVNYYYFNNGLIWSLYEPEHEKAIYKIIDTSGTGHGATAPQTLEEIAYYLIENNNGEGIEDIERLDEGEHEDFAGFRVAHI